MDMYRVSGSLFIEGTMQEAEYDFDMESDGYPSEMDVLNYMMQAGIIQIMHEETELIEDEE